MAREDLIEMEGVVTQHQRDIYTVNVVVGEEEKEITCHLSGKLRKNYIRVLVGDKVTIRISPYDLENGIITYRRR